MSAMYTREGREIKIADMTDGHLINTIKWIQKRAQSGFTVLRGGLGMEENEAWYDEEKIFGTEAKDFLGYEKYTAEAKRRGLSVYTAKDE